jgi:hypothetical protein
LADVEDDLADVEDVAAGADDVADVVGEACSPGGTVAFGDALAGSVVLGEALLELAVAASVVVAPATELVVAPATELVVAPAMVLVVALAMVEVDVLVVVGGVVGLELTAVPFRSASRACFDGGCGSVVPLGTNPTVIIIPLFSLRSVGSPV